MALSKATLKGLIITNLEAHGFKPGGTHGMAEKMAQAVADAVVDHIQATSEVSVPGGSSSGTYKVK